MEGNGIACRSWFGVIPPNLSFDFFTLDYLAGSVDRSVEFRQDSSFGTVALGSDSTMCKSNREPSTSGSKRPGRFLPSGAYCGHGLGTSRQSERWADIKPYASPYRARPRANCFTSCIALVRLFFYSE